MFEPEVIVEPMQGALVAPGPERRRPGRSEFASAELIPLLRERVASSAGYLEVVRSDDDDVAVARGIGLSIVLSAMLTTMVLLLVLLR